MGHRDVARGRQIERWAAVLRIPGPREQPEREREGEGGDDQVAGEAGGAYALAARLPSSV
ncbi:hypothetical protein ACWGDT_07630 [Streptomyces avermitilis]